jgi:hypothetical protein
MNTIRAYRDKVTRLEEEMLKLPQVELRVEHTFAAGLYARTLYIPSGVTLTGAIYFEETMNFLHKGKLVMLDTDGVSATIEGPLVVVGPPWVKRVAHALEDSVWTTMFKTENKDPDAIIAKFTAKNYSSLPPSGLAALKEH